MAVNGYVFEAVLASIFMNLYSRACGVFPVWGPVIHDAIAMSVVSLVISPIHVFLGSNILVTMAVFTILRACIWPLFATFTYNVGIVRYVIEWVVSVITLLFINGVYVQFFGSFFSKLLDRGVAFSWPLFIFATIVIALAYILMYANSEKKPKLPKVFNKIAKPKHKQVTVERKPMEKVY